MGLCCSALGVGLLKCSVQGHGRCAKAVTDMLLLRCGVDVDDVGCDGYTPLMCAVRGDPETLQTLLNHGADMELSNRKGLTALHIAAMLHKPEMVRLLLDSAEKVSFYNRGQACRSTRD